LSDLGISADDIPAAAKRIAESVLRTPLLPSVVFEEWTGAAAWSPCR
jgi:hypothetical protein